MDEPPANLPPDALREQVQAVYGLAVREVRFLPLGHDPAAWVYRVEAVGGPYFLKVQLSIRNQAGLLVPHYLQTHGIQNVVAPLPTRDGALWTETQGYALALYPFVAGQNGFQQRLTPTQWQEYGRLLSQIHSMPISADLARIVQRDTFTPTGAANIRQLDAQIGGGPFDDVACDALAHIWRARRDDIHTLVRRAEALGGRLARAAPTLVLSHADAHTGNVLLDGDQRVWLVDWDETILSPRERDLMFVVGGISRQLVNPAETEMFLRGYALDARSGGSAVTLDPLALAYYRYAWAVADIWAYAETVFRRPDLSVQLRRAEVDMFQSLFAPGNIVEIAYTSAGWHPE